MRYLEIQFIISHENCLFEKEKIMQYRKDCLQDRTVDVKFNTREEGKVSRIDNSLTRNANNIRISLFHIRVKYLVSAEFASDISRYHATRRKYHRLLIDLIVYLSSACSLARAKRANVLTFRSSARANETKTRKKMER